MKRTLLTLTLAAALCLPALFAQKSAAEEPIVLTFNLGMPPIHQRWVNAIKPWCDELEKRSNGRIKIEPYFANALGKRSDAMDSVRTGIADLAEAPFSSNPGAFPFHSQIFSAANPSMALGNAYEMLSDFYKAHPEVLKKEIKGVKDASDENTVNFGEKKKDGKYPYTVTYTPATKTFVWTINENVSNFAPVQLTYTVKLTKPETDPGTYGTEDLKGEKNVPSDKALFTNKRAVLNAINSAGAPLNPLDFPKPSVSYTVKKSSSGGGGGGRKPTVTIPDDVPTGLNGDDHYAYIVGYPNGNVEPNGNITRAEVATIFFRLLTEEVRTANSTQSNSLSDVTRGQWFNHAVSTLSSMGIVKGHNDGTFAPNAPITRAEFAAIAARFDDKNRDTSSKFTDIASHWAKNEIGIAANKGWINGYPDGTFRPNQYITRAEAMTLVNRVLNRLPENSSDLLDSMIKWPDNSDASAWYYLAVQEATNSHYYKTKENKFEKWTELRKTRDWTELEK